MANLYKPKYTKLDRKTGEKVTRKVSKWYGKYRDVNGQLQCVPLCEDKTAATAMLTELIRRMRLQQAGLLDPAEDHLAASIDGHLGDFKTHLEAKARSEKHIRETLRTIANVVSSCRVKILAELQDGGDQLEKHLAERRRAGASHRTINGDLVAVRSFCRWLIRRKRMHDDPTAGLVRLNEDEDPRVERRALTVHEAERLIQTTCDSKRVVRHLAGRDRAVLYLLAQSTGLRRGELRKLRPPSFDFSAVLPTVVVRAANAKGRRNDTLPLSPEVAAIMREYVAERAANDLVWPGSWWRQSAKMLQRDLADAGIAAIDDEGRVVDFHSQRTTFITSLARAGVTPATAQKLARHTDINLTLNTYTRLQMGELADAVGRLPRLASAVTASSNGAPIKPAVESSELDADVRCVVDAWPRMADEVRAAILRLIRKG
jgi:site-specific recombinase XerC